MIYPLIGIFYGRSQISGCSELNGYINLQRDLCGGFSYQSDAITIGYRTDDEASKDFYSDYINEIVGRVLPGTDLPLIVKHMETTHADELLNSDADIKNYTKELLSTVIPDIGSASAEIVLIMAMMVETILKQDPGRVRSAIAGDKRLAMELTLKFEEIINRLIGNWPMRDKYGLEMNNQQREIEYMKRNGPIEEYVSGTNENPYDFFTRVYGKYRDLGIMFQDDLLRIDKVLRTNLIACLRRKYKKLLSDILPSRSERAAKVAQVGAKKMEGGFKPLSPLRTAMRSHSSEKSARSS